MDIRLLEVYNTRAGASIVRNGSEYREPQFRLDAACQEVEAVGR